MALIVRQAHAAELETAGALWQRAEAARTGSPEQPAASELVSALAAAAAKPGARLFVGIMDTQLVATVYAVPLRADPTRAQVAMLAVEPTRWGQGIGSQMLTAVTDALRQQGCARLRMNVDPANHRARALYERHGWTHMGETEKVPDADEPELIYRVDLHAQP